MNWRFIDTGFNDPYMNMAIDEAMVQLIGPDDPPIIRFFDWSRPAVSIGYSQRSNEILDIPLCREKGVVIVRRPTGGGVVFHGVDVTYSVILPRQFDLDIKDVHCLVQSWIKEGLDKLGINTSQYKEIKKGRADYCFVSPSFGDIMIGDSKVGGLSGRRIKQKILCQGYLYFEDASNMIGLTKGIKTLKGKSSNLGAFGISKDQLRASIIKNWCSKLIKACLSDEEEEVASNLCENKYSQDEWNFMR